MTYIETMQALIFWGLVFGIQYFPPNINPAYFPSTFDPQGFL